MIGRSLLAAALLGCLSVQVQAQNPVARVVIYTDQNPAGLDTALMDRPTWGVVRARVYRKDGTVDPTKAVKWITQDSGAVRLRQVQAQSVAIESPPGAPLRTVRIIAALSAKRDTLVAVVREGFVAWVLDSVIYNPPAGLTRQMCFARVTRDGRRMLTADGAALPYCQNFFPNQP